MVFRHWAVIIMLGIAWGMSFMFNAILLRELQPLTISFGRVALGAVGCWAFLLWRGGNWKLPRRQALGLCAFGVLSYALPFTFYAVGQQHIASGVAGIVNATTPALAVVAAHFWPGGERATLAKSTGVLCGLLGIVMLSWPILQGQQASAVWAVFITLGAPVCYAISVNAVRRFRQIDSVVMVSWALTGAAGCLLPVALWAEDVPAAISPLALSSLLVIGLGLTAAAFIIFYWVLPKVGPTNITLPTMIAPASALTMGIWILGESLEASHLWGLAGILLGLVLIDGRVLGKRGSGKLQPKG